jgi:lipoprotein-releasing system ATP-binding protein
MLIAQDVHKSYETPRGTIPILAGVNLELKRGEAAAVMGPSGSGKSTLLYILGALEPPSSGAVTVDGVNPFTLDEKGMAAFRNRQVGFVFQDHCLLPQCTVLENVLIPTVVAAEKRNYVSRARALLEKVGLKDRMEHLPSQLSGGEKQRVALARALICAPALLLCDEPTGSLDRKSAEPVAEILMELHREQNTMLAVVTHNPELARRFPARYQLEDQALKRVE